MKKLFLTIAFLSFFLLPSTAQITFGEKKLINEGWTFTYEGQESRSVDLPHDWSIEMTPSKDLGSCTGYLPGGKAVYEKDLTIPRRESSRLQFLYFDGVYCCSSVYVNGHLLGYRPNGFLPLVYDITPYVKFGKSNRIRVEVDHSKYADSRFYTGSGIYRDVYLVSCDPVHIDNWGVSVTSPDSSTLNVKTTVVNESDAVVALEVRQRVYEKDGSALVAEISSSLSLRSGEKSSVDQAVDIPSPKLWSPSEPNLYRVETDIISGGSRLDGTVTIAGIRTLRFDSEKGFFLNGENMKIKGVCLHHDAGSLGAIVPKSVLRSRLELLKTLGVNAVRMSHNPQAEMMYDLCDEIGFMVMDEAFDEWMSPKRKWVEGWNVGKHPSLDGYAEFFGEWAVRDVADMVCRSRNHPSIIMWSIGNEIDYPNDPFSHPILDHEGINQRTVPGFKPFRPRAELLGPAAKMLVSAVHEADTTRPVTAALAGVVMSNYTDYPGALDIVGYNYTEYRYPGDHATYPDRILYGSENRHDFAAWKAVRDNDYIIGQFLWTGFDYLGEARVWPSRGAHPGLLDLCGEVKPRGWYRKVLWGGEPAIAIGTKKTSTPGPKTAVGEWTPSWNYEEGDEVWVAVMSSCDSVSFSLNGRPLDKGEGLYVENNDALLYHIPYESGTLVCTGYKDGTEAASRTLVTFGEASGIEASADWTELEGRGDVTIVRAEVVDADGNRVTSATDEISFKVRGRGELLRLENGDQNHGGNYFGTSMPACGGRAIAYIRSTGRRGSIKVKVSGLGCSQTIKLKIK